MYPAISLNHLNDYTASFVNLHFSPTLLSRITIFGCNVPNSVNVTKTLVCFPEQIVSFPNYYVSYHLYYYFTLPGRSFLVMMWKTFFPHFVHSIINGSFCYICIVIAAFDEWMNYIVITIMAYKTIIVLEDKFTYRNSRRL